ncbi:MAG: outer-membrane lipoprotein carrier protein LolA [Alphaproteobacteria bacterium]|nr:outer-membrane lipoprotein carrier protein LolA [Alphaproteobacteria bacterium]
MTLFRQAMVALCLLIALAPEARAAAPAPLSPADQAVVRKVEAYLNGIRTLSARFMQVAPDGSYAEGMAYISRPGLLRLDYDPPVPIDVYADGRMLIYYDQELKQASYLALEESPAGVLISPDIRLIGGQLIVTKVERDGGVVKIGMVQVKDSTSGEITLIFTQQPFELRQWKVKDAQGGVTSVSLFDTRSGVRLDPALFDFVPPDAAPSLRQ